MRFARPVRFGEALLMSLPAVVINGCAVFLLTFFLLGMPSSAVANAANNAINGAMSSAIAVVGTLLINSRKGRHAKKGASGDVVEDGKEF